MLPIYQITVPTPYPVGPVNAYIILSRPYTLIDTGPDTKEAREALKKGVEQAGINLHEIKKIILTHSHLDHSGLIDWLSEFSKATLFIHPAELEKMTVSDDSFQHRIQFIMKTGTPEDILRQLIELHGEVSFPAVSGKSIVELAGGEELRFEEGVLQVYHLPGHAPGHLCFFDPAGGNFFSGDFLLPDITPNPMVEFDPDCPEKRLPTLSLYLEGLQKIDKMDIRTVWPGHGEVISDYHRVIATCLQHHQERANWIMELLHGNGEKNVYEICQLVFPGLTGYDVFLGLSEIQAHLDILAKQELVKIREQEKVFYYSVTG